MASITIRNLDEAVKRKLRLRAAQRDRAMAAMRASASEIGAASRRRAGRRRLQTHEQS